jgi:hypothetical protein
MLRPPQQMLETCEGPWVCAQVAGYRRQPVKQMIPETTGETNKSNTDTASMAAGSIARRETTTLGRWKHRAYAVHHHSSEITSDKEDREG